ncbi:sugar-binding transcriptional regulator [Candidatus Enterococcus ferrettii]|uniref:Sugar-binding domain-containing protein n=1 Tax=Candidatus Enterococcus ferrettii TaxID=2815324 RepID=A0ABV0EWP5_9ENTE|nr:sugar-binding domain-containing protein [Enterococcus sp. 665A]MBO1339491.1 sugar-binding transcriptional regulator [Enterococcus sp. 665A]
MDKNREKLLIKVAYLYYIEEKKQSEISLELNINQATVSRLIQEAKEREIVKIEIKDDAYTNLIKLERYVQKKYRLRNVLIVSSTKKMTETEKSFAVAKEAALHLKQIINNDSIVGFASGKTLERMIGSLQIVKTTNATFVPLVGAPGHSNSKYHVNAIVYDIAKQFDGRSIFINATAIQEDKRTRDDIVHSKYFEEITDYWKKLDIALVGIGESLNYPIRHWRELLTEEDVTDLRLCEATAECCCTFVNPDGKIIKNDLYKRKIGIDLALLSNTPHSIAVVQGKQKAVSVLAFLKTDYINTLVIDDETMAEILRRDNDPFLKHLD